MKTVSRPCSYCGADNQLLVKQNNDYICKKCYFNAESWFLAGIIPSKKDKTLSFLRLIMRCYKFNVFNVLHIFAILDDYKLDLRVMLHVYPDLLTVIKEIQDDISFHFCNMIYEHPDKIIAEIVRISSIDFKHYQVDVEEG